MHLWIVEVKRLPDSPFTPFYGDQGMWRTRKAARKNKVFLNNRLFKWKFRVRKYVREE
jgi:hypothetical protein